MTASKRALHLKRLAKVCERKANQAGDCFQPWAINNVRMWQGQMVKALSQRNTILRAYVAARKVA